MFVSGGTSGDLAALTTARETWRRTHGRARPAAIACGPNAHSSIRLAAMVIDVPIVTVEPDAYGRLSGQNFATTVGRAATDGLDVMTVVATAGATNTGIVDDLLGAGRVAAEIGAWLHVDGAYGGTTLVSTIGRPLLAGIEAADSFVLDPHKWLFAPFDCAAVVYRDPKLAGAALTQHAEYLETLDANAEWNPSDFAHSHDPPGPRASAVVLARGTRRGRLRPSGQPWDRTRPGGCGHGPRSRPPRARARSRAVGGAVPRRGWEAGDYQRGRTMPWQTASRSSYPPCMTARRCSGCASSNPTTTEQDIESIFAAMG